MVFSEGTSAVVAQNKNDKNIAFIFKFLHHKQKIQKKEEKSEILFKLDNNKTSS